MTAVVLAGGRGRRLAASDASTLTSAAQRQAAARGLKALMPVGPAQRPLVDYALSRLAAAGCSEAVLVVPPDHAGLAAHLAAHPPALRPRFAVQPVADGTASAVAAAAPLVSGATCLVVNGDNLYPLPALRALVDLDTCGVAAFTRETLERESGFAPARIAAFARIECDAGGWLTGLYEKPPADSLEHATLMSLNLWRMDRAMMAACGDVARSPRGEFELPDAVMLAVARGSRVRVVAVGGTVLDLTTAADVAVVSRALADGEAVA